MVSPIWRFRFSYENAGRRCCVEISGEWDMAAAEQMARDNAAEFLGVYPVSPISARASRLIPILPERTATQ